MPFILCVTLGCAQKQKTAIIQEKVEVSDTQKTLDSGNIILKRHTEHYVSYEYQNVRIDKVALLAAEYCEKKSTNKKAYLREIVMRENHSRLATFDCIDLQK